MDALIGGGNAILLLLSAMGIAGALIIAFVAWRRSEPGIMRAFLGGATMITLAYGTGLIAASATSTTRVIPPGETKWFCGFYLDCHLGVSITDADTVSSVPENSGNLEAAGNFHIITLRLHNSAKNPNLDMLLYRPRARIVDVRGIEYRRSAAAEAAIASRERPAVLGTETTVRHGKVEATIVFDLPKGIQDPHLVLSEGWILDRVIERGLINDENSLFHKPTLMALDGSSLTASRVAQ